MITIDGRCGVSSCSPDIYRMIGKCGNCGESDLLLLFTVGHSTEALICPRCGNKRVYADRLATDDEIPEALPTPTPQPKGDR